MAAWTTTSLQGLRSQKTPLQPTRSKQAYLTDGFRGVQQLTMAQTHLDGPSAWEGLVGADEAGAGRLSGRFGLGCPTFPLPSSRRLIVSGTKKGRHKTGGQKTQTLSA